jgi:hypothetical protein
MNGDLTVTLPPPLPSGQQVGPLDQAVLLMANGQFGVAAELFHQLADSMDPPEGLLYEYCLAFAHCNDGFNFARNGDRPKAVASLTQAINRFEGEVLPLVDEIQEVEERNNTRIGFVLSVAGAKAGKYTSQMMDDIIKEDFDSALETAGDIFADLDQTKSVIDACASEINASGGQVAEVKQLKSVLSITALGLHGLVAYAEAENASASNNWPKAKNSFKVAKQQLYKARDAYSAVPQMAAQSQMWQSVVEMLVEPGLRRCKNLQKMWEELERYKAGMLDVARAVGAADITNINSNNLQATLDVKLTIINEFEDRTRAALNDLRKAIKAAPIDELRRKAAIGALDDIISTPEHETGFFEKFKKFTKDGAEIVTDIAKAVAPVARAWNVFAPFFGLPVLPLPAPAKAEPGGD